MKKSVITLVAVTAIAASGLAFANGLGLGIKGSPHDFTDDVAVTGGAARDEAWNTRNEICRVCHVPHDHALSSQYYLNGLLWNHKVSAATYSMYDVAFSSTIDGVQDAQPGGPSKLCLGCHDGTIAVDTYDKYAGTPGNVMGTIYAGAIAGYRVGTFTDGTDVDLRGTHPLSIEYDATADPGLFASTSTMGTSGKIDDVLYFNKVECSSCHDVHDSAEAVAATHLLRVENGAANPSGLCLTCHDK